MAPDDESRHDLFVLLERDTSRETAAALMRHIPPAGWPDFATKADVAVLGERMNAMKEELRREFRDQTHKLLYWLVPLMVGSMVASITVAAQAG